MRFLGPGCRQATVQDSAPDRLDAFAAYGAYLDDIRERLPKTLRRIAGPTALHDAAFHELSIDLPRGIVELTLLGDDGQGGSQTMKLTYTGASRFSIESCEADRVLPLRGIRRSSVP